jgi:trehalose-6-phosphate synthase
MNEFFKSEYEKADTILKYFMGMIEQHVSWPNKELIRCFTNSFSEILDGLYQEQVVLVDSLQRKEERINELEAKEWAELEEL